MKLADRANFPLQDCNYYRDVIRASLETVANSGQTILGSGVKGFEEDFARWLGDGFTADHCVGVGNGTDALELAMRCAGVQAGDGVIVPSHTAYATVAAILRVGAQAIFADVNPDRPVIAVRDVERLLEENGSTVRAVIAVHLYGEACDLKILQDLCRQHRVALIEDCAQATGTLYEGRRVGTWGDYAAFSFYPTKNLAALGDGGMLVVGKDSELIDRQRARRLRFYGWDESKQAVQFGLNSRLDEVQAWILKGKLPDLDNQVDRRRNLALEYRRRIEPWAEMANVTLPGNETNWKHSYHLFVIRVDPQCRQEIIDDGSKAGIPYGIHYPLACHQHSFIKKTIPLSSALPHTEHWSASVLTLPLNPYLNETDIEQVSSHLHQFLTSN